MPTQATHDSDRRERIDRGFVSISTSVHDVWDFTDARSPDSTDDFSCYPDPRCNHNATLLRPHLIVVHLRRPVQDYGTSLTKYVAANPQESLARFRNVIRAVVPPSRAPSTHSWCNGKS